LTQLYKLQHHIIITKRFKLRFDTFESLISIGKLRMDLGIKGRWALVCGASKGLGYGCAAALAAEGVNLVIVARTASSLDAAAAKLRNSGVQVHAVAADITTPAGRDAVFAIRQDFDILVTNAGGPPTGNFRDWNRDAWLAAIDANMLTPIELIKTVVDGMAARGFGRIINITSSAVKSPIDILGLSNGARSGLTGFVAGLARGDFVAKNVTINNVLPGIFDTDRLAGNFAAQAAKRGLDAADMRAARIAEHPAKRLGDPAEFGAYVAFVCSQYAGYINGQNLLIDGGSYPGTF
jgi:3-oxoacyl-[acyl-carrier protein] reductase